MNDLRHAFRRLRRQPGFALTAILTLGLCLGANLSILAVLDAVVLRTLPFPSADRLVTLYNSYPKAGLDRDRTSLHNYYSWREHVDAFASVAAIRPGSETVGALGATEQLSVLRVSPEFFATIGVEPATGRAFVDEEMEPGQHQVAIISDAYSRQHYADAATALGQTIRIAGENRTIVGVLPTGFAWLTNDAPIYLPLATNQEDRAVNSLHVGSVDTIARLNPGIGIDEAQSQVEADNQVQALNFPWADEVAAAGFQVTVVGLQADHIASIRPTLILLQAGVWCLLLIGCVNLINLMLVRVNVRAKEIALRQALGARRTHLLRDVLSENLLLCLFGAGVGLLIGVVSIAAWSRLGADLLPLSTPLAIDARLLTMHALSAVALAGLISMPVLWISLRRKALNALHAQARGGSVNRASQRLRHGFIVSQVALAFMLLSCAGLLVTSLERAMAVSPGFRTDQLITGELALSQGSYQSIAGRAEIVERLLDRVAQQPGVSAAAVSTNLPAKGRNSDNDNNVMTVVGYQPDPGAPPTLHYTYGVSGAYFEAMSIPLVSGRYLNRNDATSEQRYCVVDAEFARIHWPDGTAIGQRVFNGPDVGPEDQAFTVVGVVGSVHQTDLTDATRNGAIYFPYRHFANDQVYLVAQTAQPSESAIPMLRQRVREVDPELALAGLSTMQARVDRTLLPRKAPALLALVFAAVALILAGIGTYGVLSYAVAQRRGEIGLRMAIGALPGQIRQQFLSLGARLLIIGGLIGFAGAWMAGRALRSLLYQVSEFDPTVWLSSAGLLGAVALLACLIPAQRASRISPTAVLNED